MTGAMYAAIGGLKTHMANLNVIGNNIANVNTTGFKAQRMTFQETLYTTNRAGANSTLVLGGNSPSQVGYGVRTGSIDLDMSNGTPNPTGFMLDCSIQGDGFFLCGDKDIQVNSAEDLKKFNLTRVGDLWVDNAGYLCKQDGQVVYGFAMVQNPYYKPNASDAEKSAAILAGSNTEDKYMVSSELTPLRLPLAAAVPTVENGGAVVNGNDITYNWQTGDPVYDILGACDADPNNCNMRRKVSLVDEDGVYLGKVDNTGMELPAGYNIPAATNTGTGGNTGTGTGTTTKYTGPIPNQNNECIICKSYSINSQGGITGICENGDTIMLGYVAIGSADAPNAVTHIGGQYYKCMEGAGNMHVGVPGGVMAGRYLNNKISVPNTTGGAGGAGGTANPQPLTSDAIGQGGGVEILPGYLENSTADVATEFSNMIITQRGYQANTRIVTVTDSMLEELVNMKR